MRILNGDIPFHEYSVSASPRFRPVANDVSGLESSAGLTQSSVITRVHVQGCPTTLLMTLIVMLDLLSGLRDSQRLPVVLSIITP